MKTFHIIMMVAWTVFSICYAVPYYTSGFKDQTSLAIALAAIAIAGIHDIKYRMPK